jgi:hypothetical protein
MFVSCDNDFAMVYALSMEREIRADRALKYDMKPTADSGIIRANIPPVLSLNAIERVLTTM